MEQRFITSNKLETDPRRGVQICTRVKCVNLWLFAREGAEIPLRLLLQQVVIYFNNNAELLKLGSVCG